MLIGLAPLAAILLQSSFAGAYHGQNWKELCKGLSLTVLMAFLTSRAGRCSKVFWVLTGLPAVPSHRPADISAVYRPQMTDFLSLCAALVNWIKEESNLILQMKSERNVEDERKQEYPPAHG